MKMKIKTAHIIIALIIIVVIYFVFFRKKKKTDEAAGEDEPNKKGSGFVTAFPESEYEEVIFNDESALTPSNEEYEDTNVIIARDTALAAKEGYESQKNTSPVIVQLKPVLKDISGATALKTATNVKQKQAVSVNSLFQAK